MSKRFTVYPNGPMTKEEYTRRSRQAQALEVFLNYFFDKILLMRPTFFEEYFLKYGTDFSHINEEIILMSPHLRI